MGNVKKVTHEERKKQLTKHRNLSNRSQEQIDSHPFVMAKKNLISKHNAAIKKLLDECTHDEVERKSSYFSGNYYDKASTSYWDECLLCGKTLNHKEETHSWYG